MSMPCSLLSSHNQSLSANTFGSLARIRSQRAFHTESCPRCTTSVTHLHKISLLLECTILKIPSISTTKVQETMRLWLCPHLSTLSMQRSWHARCPNQKNDGSHKSMLNSYRQSDVVMITLLLVMITRYHWVLLGYWVPFMHHGRQAYQSGQYSAKFV